jgi:hydrogenase expression/formation protein HypC
MCVAIPARVCELLPGERAVIEMAGVSQEISLALVEDVKVGDYVIVHVGFALSRLDAAEAEETLKLLGEIVTQLEAERARTG